MKQAILLVLLITIFSASHAQKKIFLRVYNTEGKKISKGYYVNSSDSMLTLYSKSGMREVPATSLGYVKTRRSVLHTIIAGTMVAVVPLGIMMVSSDEKTDITPRVKRNGKKVITPEDAHVYSPSTPNNITTVALAKRTTYKLDGSLNTWKQNKKMFEMLPRVQ